MYGEKDAVMQRFSVLAIVCSVLAVGFLSGCGDDTSSDLAILGQYVDNYDTNHEITNEMWTSGESGFMITQFSNESQMLIAQNSSENEWSANLWSRFDWTEDSDGLWICQTAYDAESEEAAMNIAAADATDPANTGCSSFSWTKLVAAGE
jgi:hypothetical protein